MFLGRSNTFFSSVIYTSVWRSQRQLLSWEQDLEEREWGNCGCLKGGQLIRGSKMRNGDRSWGTEDELCPLGKIPDFGTSGQFWATCREPGVLYTTLSTWNCFSCLWPRMWICGEDQSWKTLEAGLNISSHKLPSDKGSSSILVVQKWANGERYMTMLSRIPTGKIHLFLSHPS